MFVMCGRVTLTKSAMNEIVAELDAEISLEHAALYRPRYNAAPSDQHWILDYGADRRTLRPATWGCRAAQRLLINVRGERVASGEAFRRSFASERCAIVTDGFLEWNRDRTPFWFRRADGRLLLLAGLKQSSQEPSDGPHPRFTILTTRPNPLVSFIHDRMPVVVDIGDLDEWLTAPPTVAAALIRPAPDQALNSVAVSRRVNSVKHDDPACLLPTHDPPPSARQLKLF